MLAHRALAILLTLLLPYTLAARLKKAPTPQDLAEKYARIYNTYSERAYNQQAFYAHAAYETDPSGKKYAKTNPETPGRTKLWNDAKKSTDTAFEAWNEHKKLVEHNLQISPLTKWKPTRAHKAKFKDVGSKNTIEEALNMPIDTPALHGGKKRPVTSDQPGPDTARLKRGKGSPNFQASKSKIK